MKFLSKSAAATKAVNYRRASGRAHGTRRRALGPVDGAEASARISAAWTMRSSSPWSRGPPTALAAQSDRLHPSGFRQWLAVRTFCHHVQRVRTGSFRSSGLLAGRGGYRRGAIGPYELGASRTAASGWRRAAGTRMMFHGTIPCASSSCAQGGSAAPVTPRQQAG